MMYTEIQFVTYDAFYDLHSLTTISLIYYEYGNMDSNVFT